MEQEKAALKVQLRNLETELSKLSMRETVFIEVIAHFRSRLENIDVKRRKVKQNIQDIKMQIRAIDSASDSK